MSRPFRRFRDRVSRQERQELFLQFKTTELNEHSELVKAFRDLNMEEDNSGVMLINACDRAKGQLTINEWYSGSHGKISRERGGDSEKSHGISRGRG